jgi:Terminase large subunit, T4likevirus-type, N-terminal
VTRAATKPKPRKRAKTAPVDDPGTSVAAFAERVLHRPLWPHQKRLGESKAFIRTVAAARRTGKTDYAETGAMWTAFRERNVKVLILSATQDAARRLTESIGQRLNSNPLTRGAVVDDFATRIRLSNGSEIISLPASQRQVRGYGKGVRLVILDEAGFMPGELWAAAHYTALDERPHSRILLLGTPWGPAEHFFRRAFLAGKDGDPDHFTVQWTFEANPRLDRAYLERQRDRVSPSEYAAEVLGEWSDAVGSLFPRELLDKHTADIIIPELDALRGPARGIVGVDWGVSFDRSAAVGIFRTPVAALNPERPNSPCFVALPYVWRVKTPLHEVVDDVVASLAHFAYVAPEVNGVGAMPSTELKRRAVQTREARRDKGKRSWSFVNTTAASKTAAYGLVLGLLERGQLVLPRHPALLRQLAGLRFSQGERGFMRIEAEDAAVHDDVADALMLAMLPRRPPGTKRVVCHMALAGSKRAVPDARAPELDCPVITTGGGLRLYAQPTLQSASDTNYSLYAPKIRPKPEGFRAGRFFVKTTSKGAANVR